ncbi:Uncharacterized protein SCF082_LOCUS16059 [Durusdinium trenchii]|uniref:Uncharacterized protein n=1 Tax=Durusdinium trenchii TaxID=1381693 RepID=A0ABP0K948_9DINO
MAIRVGLGASPDSTPLAKPKRYGFGAQTHRERCLVKYEMQYIRAWEIEDKRRQRELLDLEVMRLRFRKEGEAEESQLEGQREVLQKGLAKRKRYEGYEELSASVNTKRPQHESKAQIQKLTVELQQMEQQQKRLAELSQHRDERSKLLMKAIEELDKDLLAEQEFRFENFGPDEPEAGESSAGQAETKFQCAVIMWF